MSKEVRSERPIHQILTAEKHKQLVDGIKPTANVSATEQLASIKIKPIDEMSNREFIDFYLKIATSF